MELEGKRVLVRVDYNVPINNGIIVDDKKIRASIPTVNFLLEKSCKIILMSHLDRPKDLLKKGKNAEEIKKELTLKPVADGLSEILGLDVGFVDDCIDVDIPEDKDICLLENIRFHEEEEKNDNEFARKLSLNGDVYVNNAFGNCHRKHASIVAITKFLPSCAGFLIERETEQLSKLLSPDKPFIVVVGGAKSDKIKALAAISKKADRILVGGALANSFLKAEGYEIGASKFNGEAFSVAREIIQMTGKKLMLPDDFITADKFSDDANTKETDIMGLPKSWMILDIGGKTIRRYKEELKNAKTVLWAGPMGVFEMERFSNGTRQILEFLGKLKATVIAGGGDTAAAIGKFNSAGSIMHISTGGGASLEFIEKGGKLPGLVALNEAYKLTC